MENNEEKSNKSFVAKLLGKVEARLKGPERGLFVLGLIFLTVFILSGVADLIRPNLIYKVGMLSGLLALLVLLFIYYFKIVKSSTHLDMAPTTISCGVVTVSTAAVQSPQEIVLLLRQMLLNRQSYPVPHGEITNGRPQETDGLIANTEEMKKEISQQMEAAIREHDNSLLEKLKQLAASHPQLPDSGNDSQG